jgi:hypothetical protein
MTAGASMTKELTATATEVQMSNGASRSRNRVRVLAIDGCGASAGDTLLVDVALARLEACFRRQASGLDAHIADFLRPGRLLRSERGGRDARLQAAAAHRHRRTRDLQDRAPVTTNISNRSQVL